jgi:2-C-methyl-D-erythritol 4-phosphate cytidylyltransferase
MIFNDIIIKKNKHYYIDFLEKYKTIKNKNIKNSIYNPFIIIYNITKELTLIKYSTKINIWNFENNYLQCVDKYLSIVNNEFILTNHPITTFYITNNFIHDLNNNYLSIDVYGTIIISKHPLSTIILYKKMLLFIKSKLHILFEINNCINSIQKINFSNIFNKTCKNIDGLNIGILLSAGNSTRFHNNTIKQLFIMDNKPLLLHSLDIMYPLLDLIIIIVNTTNFSQIQQITKSYKNVILVINDVDCRLETIWSGIVYLYEKQYNINKIIIHDSARPFITKQHIYNLIHSSKSYIHYCTKITNGLLNIYNNETIREDFIQLCSPLSINYDIAYFIYKNYMSKEHRITWEFFYIVKLLNIDYEFLYDTDKYLRKITYYEDIIQ